MSENENKLVSVLLPAFNASQFIEQAIESILNQTYSNLELLIVDDASSDNTYKKIEKYLYDNRVKLFSHKENKGYLGSINFLFSECSGEYITFLDADDWCREDRIALLVSAFDRDAELGCVGSFCSRLYLDGKEELVTFENQYEKILNKLPERFEFIGAALMVKKSVLEHIGGYETFFDRIGAEHLYWGGKIILKFKTINLPEPLYHYREVSNSFSDSNKKKIMGQLSTEMAKYAIYFLKNYQIDIFLFENVNLKKSILNFLLMKYYFWNDYYFQGLKHYILSFFYADFNSTERSSLIKMYTNKKIRFFLTRST